jgi:DNA-binding transcriptional regulator GbsR (MarR family)
MARSAPRPPPPKTVRPARAAKPASRRATPARKAVRPEVDEHEVARFVEQAGLTYEEMGLPPMGGRIIGWLAVCDPPHQSMAELQQAVRASKGSISTMTRMLLAAGLVERVPVPHDRREYVRIPPFAFDQVTHQLAARTERIRRLAADGLAVLRDAPPARRERLERLQAFYEFLGRELPRVIARFERETRRTRTPGRRQVSKPV